MADAIGRIVRTGNCKEEVSISTFPQSSAMYAYLKLIHSQAPSVDVRYVLKVLNETDRRSWRAQRGGGRQCCAWL